MRKAWTPMLDSFFWGKNRSITWTHTRSKKRLDRKEAFRFRPYRAGDKVPGIQEHAMGAKAERGHLRLEVGSPDCCKAGKEHGSFHPGRTQALHQQSKDKARLRGMRLR